MEYHGKTKKELIDEINTLNQRIDQLQTLLNSQKDESYTDRESSISESVINNFQEPVVVAQDGIHKYVNKKLADLDGYSVEELTGKTIKDLIHPDDYFKVLENYKKKMNGQSVDNYRFRFIHKQGHCVWAEIFGTQILWKGRSAVLDFVKDVTEQVKTEGELLRSRRQFLDINNFLPDATIAIDKDGIVIAWNKKMEEMLNIKAKNMLGKGNYEYSLPFYNERRPMLLDILIRPDKKIEKKYLFCKRTKNGILGETRVNLGGESRILLCHASLMYDHENNIVGAIESLRDITRIKKYESDLQEQSKELKKINISLEESNIALRVLLNNRDKEKIELEEKIFINIKKSILPFMEQLRISNLSHGQARYLDIIKSHLTNITSDFIRNIMGKYSGMTPREVEMSSLIKDGKSTKEIASLLNISINTVNKYRKTIRKKLGLKSKADNLRMHLTQTN
ncbi:MAG: PAS domain S-box protein [Nitrospirota bacterium]|nr:PAS domain S-box protein [Nitrospirota bacterium]